MKKPLPRGITMRSDGLYMGRFQYEGEVYPAIYGKTVKEVEEKLDVLRYEVKHQMFTPKSKITVDEWFDIWLRDYRGVRVKKGTKAVYKDMYSARIKPYLGGKKMTSIRIEQIQKLYNQMADNGYAEGTIKIVNVILYGMFKQAVKSGMLTKNPVEMVVIPRVEKRRVEKRKERIALTLDQQNTFLEYAEKYSKDYRIFKLALCTGMRNGEIRGLEWGTDIDFDNRIIHVTGTLKYIKGVGNYKDSPKSDSSARDIPMLNVCYELLKEQKQIQDKQKEIAGELWKPKDGLEDLVFTTSDGANISRERITRELNKVISKIRDDEGGFPDITFHTLRHTFATRGLEQGIPMRIMQSILGHKTFAMTTDLYSHVLPTKKEAEMKKMDEVFL